MASSATRSPASAKAASRRRDAATPVMPPVEVQIPREEVAKRAFEKFVARGCAHGFDERDWFDAEDELRAEYLERQ